MAGISLVHVDVGAAGIVNEGDISINSSVSGSASYGNVSLAVAGIQMSFGDIAGGVENSGTISVTTATSSSSSSVSINLQGAGLYLGEGSISGGIDNSGSITVKQSSNCYAEAV